MAFHTKAEIKASNRQIARERARDRRRAALYPRRRRTAESDAKKMSYYIRSDIALISSLMPVDKNGRAIETGTLPFQALDLRKQLLFSWIDAMSMIKARILEPKNFTVKGAGERFVEFVSTECGWKDCHRVSIPVLINDFKLRRRVGKPTAGLSLMRYLKKRVSPHLDKGRDVRATDVDPYISDLLRDRGIKKGTDEDVVIKQNELVLLLYGLRNSRVHQMRNQGEGQEAFVDPRTDEPVYMDFNNDGELHLVFPETFVHKLVLTGVDSLERLCNGNNVSPYDYLPENSTWALKDWTPNKTWKRARGSYALRMSAARIVRRRMPSDDERLGSHE